MLELLGVNPVHAVFGFGGSIIYFFFLKQEVNVYLLTMIPVTGILTGAALTPFLIPAFEKYLWKLPEGGSQNGLALFLGFVSLRLIFPAAIVVSDWANSHLVHVLNYASRIIQAVTGKGDSDDSNTR